MSGAVDALAFQDLDLDAAEIAGDVTWEPPKVRLNLMTAYIRTFKIKEDIEGALKNTTRNLVKLCQ